MSANVSRPQPVRALLHQRRISNRALAQQLKCSPQFVSQVLLGQAKPPNRVRSLLVELLQTPADSLFDPDLLLAPSRSPGDAEMERLSGATR